MSMICRVICRLDEFNKWSHRRDSGEEDCRKTFLCGLFLSVFFLLVFLMMSENYIDAVLTSSVILVFANMLAACVIGRYSFIPKRTSLTEYAYFSLGTGIPLILMTYKYGVLVFFILYLHVTAFPVITALVVIAVGKILDRLLSEE